MPYPQSKKEKTVAEDRFNVVGLSTFILHHNFLGSVFMEKLGRVLKHDRYCRKLDLCANSIKESDVLGEFMTSFFANETILNIDFRENSGYTPVVQKKVALTLLKNIEIARERQGAVKASWIDPEILQLSKRESNHIVAKLNIVAEEEKGYLDSNEPAFTQILGPHADSRLERTELHLDQINQKFQLYL